LVLEDIIDCSAKYEKTYLDQVKATDIHTIRNVNSMFPEFTRTSQLLDSNFCQKLKAYVQTLTKESTKRLNQVIDDDGEEERLPEKLEAFQNLIVLQRLLEWRSRE
jgi:hypothetical protein